MPEGAYSETNYTEDFHGRFPLGFVAALDTDPSKKLSEKVPYSSFGINFGITYQLKVSGKIKQYSHISLN